MSMNRSMRAVDFSPDTERMASQSVIRLQATKPKSKNTDGTRFETTRIDGDGPVDQKH